MARFTLPRIRAADPLASKEGRAMPAFVQFWDRICRQIEGQENSQNDLIADLSVIVGQLQAITQIAQEAQNAANNAQSTADSGTTVSGSATDPAINITGSGWVPGPQVDLVGVVAGNLTITGSGPQQDNDVEVSGARGQMVCQFRVVEIVSGVDTVIFTGEFRAFTEGDGMALITNNSASDVSAFVSARASTGAVSYRIDAKGTGARAIDSLVLYVFARRA